ncbi:MAG TPA: PQQ-binding-like beta-propeller repeat protein, partial [Gaiellaceae bacterium]|nr:PQQ-binding-like beta-propeller repeat protein [Gaiellaceae bacterium]
SLIAVDLNTGKMRWWQQQLSSNEWSYDTSQPPMVYTAKVGGKTERIVSVASMEGVWFAYNAATGAPIWQRVKVIDNVEHPNLKPGKPVVIYPSSLGGLNYSPASFDPQTGYVYNAASETASVLVQQTSAQEERQALVAGDVFLGLANGDYGQYLQSGWKDYGSVSAINVSTGKRVWKFDTPQPERGGPTLTASGIGFVGGGDGVLRAFDAKTGKVLWKFQTGYQIADGPSIYSVGGKEYIAIGVGGTPTSSGGGIQASQVQVFALGGSSTESKPPALPDLRADRSTASAASAVVPARKPAAARHASASAAAKVTGPSGLAIKVWNANSSNIDTVFGHVTLSGRPVSGVQLRVDGWLDPNRTNASGAFPYPLDVSTPARHIATIVDVSGAKIGGRPLSAAERNALLGKAGGISVGYRVSGLSAKRSGGNIVVTGRLSYGSGAPPTVVLYSYELRGKITDAHGDPVKGAIVTTRTNDRQYWTQSRPSGANGAYASFLVAADQEGDNPVPMQVGIAFGGASYAEPAADQIMFAKLKSATLNVQLPASPGAGLAKSSLQPQATAGAIYQGLLVGVSGQGGATIKPVSATWPDRNGAFTIVLPASAAGQTVHLWQAQRQFFSSTAARPGGPIDLAAAFPSAVPTNAPQGLAALKLP